MHSHPDGLLDAYDFSDRPDVKCPLKRVEIRKEPDVSCTYTSHKSDVLVGITKDNSPHVKSSMQAYSLKLL